MPKRSVGPDPRSWLADAETRDAKPDGWRDNPFGEQDDLNWQAPKNDTERSYIAAAQTQHRASQAIRSLAKRKGIPIEGVAKEIGMSPDGLRRILNGSAHAYLTDLARIATVLDREARVTFRRVSSDSPAEERPR